MLNYLSDLMEDANDFSWHGAKAAHAVLMCDMERRAVTWDDTACINRVRWAHAQKHVSNFRNFAKNGEMINKRPWFCTLYQSGACTYAKDHESNGKLHRHICANCLDKGRQLNHPEKDCLFSKNSQKRAVSCSKPKKPLGSYEINRDDSQLAMTDNVNNCSVNKKMVYTTRFVNNSKLSQSKIQSMMAMSKNRH